MSHEKPEKHTHFEDGVEHTSYRLPSGVIMSTEIHPGPRPPLDELIKQLGIEVDGCCASFRPQH